MDPETRRSCGRAELVVVRRERESVEVLSSQQRARQVDGVQGAQGRRKGFGRTLEHDRIQRDKAESLDGLEHVCSVVRDLPIIEAKAHPGAIDGPQAFEPCAAHEIRI